MAEQRLPTVDADDGAWGTILNQFLNKEHYNGDADLNQATSENGGHKTITLQPGAIGAGTAPLKFTTGSLMTGVEAGAVEFLTNKLYYSTTTPSRKIIAAYDEGTPGAIGDVYYRDSSGNFTRIAIGSAGQLMKVSGGIPSWSTVLSGTNIITVGTTQPSTPTAGDLWIDTN